MEISKETAIIHENICHPRKMFRGITDPLLVMSYKTIAEEGQIAEIRHQELSVVCVNPGSQDEPPDYDVDCIGLLIVRPILKYPKRG